MRSRVRLIPASGEAKRRLRRGLAMCLAPVAPFRVRTFSVYYVPPQSSRSTQHEREALGCTRKNELSYRWNRTKVALRLKQPEEQPYCTKPWSTSIRDLQFSPEITLSLSLYQDPWRVHCRRMLPWKYSPNIPPPP